MPARSPAPGDILFTWSIAALGWVSSCGWIFRLPLPDLLKPILALVLGMLFTRLAEARIRRLRRTRRPG